MTTAVQDLLRNFGSLSEAEKHQATVAILSQVLASDYGSIPEAGLAELADELFQALDAAEENHAQG